MQIHRVRRSLTIPSIIPVVPNAPPCHARAMTAIHDPARAPVGGFGPPSPVVFVDGEFLSTEEARVSSHANVLSYGTGTFEGIRASWNERDGELYLLEPWAHYERMSRSARVLGLELPYGTHELVEISRELLRRNGARSDAYLRPLYVLAGDTLAVRLDGVPARFQIAVTPIVGDYIDLGGVRCTVSSWRRAPDDVLPGRAKLCGSYVGPALAKSEAIARGYDEALMLNAAGHVAEGTTSNVFMRRGDAWVTPPVTDDILEGITRAQVMELLAEHTGRPVAERSIQRSELYACDELLLCGTAALVVPVVSVDDRPVGDGRPGAETRRLLDALRAVARRQDDRRHHWTTPVYGGTA
jgi:branched-chain amino acid aminotransferase